MICTSHESVIYEQRNTELEIIYMNLRTGTTLRCMPIPVLCLHTTPVCSLFRAPPSLFQFIHFSLIHEKYSEAFPKPHP